MEYEALVVVLTTNMMKMTKRRIMKPMMKTMVMASWHSMSNLVAKLDRMPHSLGLSSGFPPSKVCQRIFCSFQACISPTSPASS